MLYIPLMSRIPSGWERARFWRLLVAGLVSLGKDLFSLKTIVLLNGFAAVGAGRYNTPLGAFE
jgi:hypothetical protein